MFKQKRREIKARNRKNFENEEQYTLNGPGKRYYDAEVGQKIVKICLSAGDLLIQQSYKIQYPTINRLEKGRADASEAAIEVVFGMFDRKKLSVRDALMIGMDNNWDNDVCKIEIIKQLGFGVE